MLVYLKPLYLRAAVVMEASREPLGVIEDPNRDIGAFRPRPKAEAHATTTARTKTSPCLFTGIVASWITEPVDLVTSKSGKCRNRGADRLSTHAAMTMGDSLGQGRSFKSHRPTQTSSGDRHGLALHDGCLLIRSQWLEFPTFGQPWQDGRLPNHPLPIWGEGWGEGRAYLPRPQYVVL